MRKVGDFSCLGAGQNGLQLGMFVRLSLHKYCYGGSGEHYFVDMLLWLQFAAHLPPHCSSLMPTPMNPRRSSFNEVRLHLLFLAALCAPLPTTWSAALACGEEVYSLSAHYLMGSAHSQCGATVGEFGAGSGRPGESSEVSRCRGRRMQQP